MLKKGVGRNSLKVYLFFHGFLRRVFSLLRAGEILDILYITYISLWLEDIDTSCPRFYFASSPGDFGGSFNMSYHFNYCPANPGSGASPHLFTTISLFKTLLYPELGMRLRSPPPLFQNWFSLTLFPLSDEGATSALGF